MGLKLIYLASCLLVLTMAPTNSYSAWQGPTELISGEWGNGDGNFGIERGDTSDQLPWLTAILFDGKIVISDKPNEREVVCNSDGTLFKVVPWYIFKDGSKIVNPDYPVYKYWNVQGYTPEGSIWFKIDKYSLKSQSGQLLKTSTTRPVELGNWSNASQVGGGFRHILAYPDKTYSYVLPWKTLNGYQRDSTGNLVVVAVADPTPTVYKISPCGNILGQLQIPASKGHVVGTMGKEVVKELDYEFGQPVIAQNGDVYAWKRTPTNYSILKWTWVDDPNVPSGPDSPSGLTAMPSTTGIYLTWTASPGDPGCVTNYEISRATSAGGVGSTVGTVSAGTVKYNDTTASVGTTYYYKVRAAAGSEFSPYTAEVSGKR